MMENGFLEEFIKFKSETNLGFNYKNEIFPLGLYIKY